MVQADLTALVSSYVESPTYEEIIAALKPAAKKLERIIKREGDARQSAQRSGIKRRNGW